MAVFKINCRKISRPIHGNARKAALAFIIFSTLGWTVFVVFLGLTTLDEIVINAKCINQKSRLDAVFTPHWYFLIANPILYTLAVVALLLNKEGYFQMIINFLIATLFLCGGAIIYTDWVIYDGGLKYLFEFGACLISLAAIVLYSMLVPHFNPVTATVEEQTDIPLDNYEIQPFTNGMNPSNTIVAKNEAYNSRATLKLEQGQEAAENTKKDECIVPDDLQEEEYVVNEPFYEDYQENDHGEEVYEDMETVQNTDYEELAVH